MSLFKQVVDFKILSIKHLKFARRHNWHTTVHYQSVRQRIDRAQLAIKLQIVDRWGLNTP